MHGVLVLHRLGMEVSVRYGRPDATDEQVDPRGSPGADAGGCGRLCAPDTWLPCHLANCEPLPPAQTDGLCLAQVIAAAQQANAHDFVMQFPSGWACLSQPSNGWQPCCMPLVPPLPPAFASALVRDTRTVPQCGPLGHVLS